MKILNNSSVQLFLWNGTRTVVQTPVSSVPAIGEWMHVMAVYDGTTANIYIDGQLSRTQVIVD
jgi:hypothetical protein